MKMTAEEVRTAFDYNPHTGALTWKLTYSNRRKSGKRAGCLHGGRWTVCLNYKQALLHRVVWLHYYGAPPVNVIDHINGDAADNRIVNLRDVSQGVNLQNQRMAKSNNKTGLLGVSWYSKNSCWRARIVANGAQKTLGYFKDPHEAHAAYVMAKRVLHIGNTI